MININCLIPFESKVEFKNPVKEICSISLEHEITHNESELLGNFFVSGTYKEHELSINESEFKFTIPFSVELPEKIEKDSLIFDIDNFTYTLEENSMNVKIDYLIVADEVRNEDPIDLIYDEDERTNSQILEIVSEETEEEPMLTNEEKTIIEKHSIDKTIEAEYIKNINAEDDYTTLKIHIVKEGESIDTISTLYQVDKELIYNFNMIDNINLNDKLIIPIQND